MILSARYANADHSAAVMTTDDNGDVAVEAVNEAAWGELMAWGVPTDFVIPPAPVPEVISDRQFFEALALQGTITHSEALLAVKMGTIPAVLQSFLANMTGNDAFKAEMLLSGAVEFHRSHPLTIAIGGAQDMTPAQIDDFFRFASGL